MLSFILLNLESVEKKGGKIQQLEYLEKNEVKRIFCSF